MAYSPAMTLRRFASVALSIPLALGIGGALAPAASAAELTITDPPRDNVKGGLDIVSGVLNNDDYVLSTTVSFRKDTNGTVIVGLRARDGGLLRLVSRHRAGEAGSALLLNRKGRVACETLNVTWDNSAASVTFTLASACLWKGNYGALRPWYLIEGLRSGNDIDIARTKAFVARG